MFNADDFKRDIVKNGIARGNRYLLEINPPVGLVSAALSDTDLPALQLRINSVELPGKQIATTEVKHYGPLTKRPYATIYEDLNFEIMLSSNLIERRFFSAWMDLAYNPVTARVGYFNDITTDIKFKSFGEQNTNTLYQCLFERCFPVSIGALNYAYANEDILTMQVSIAYKKWGEESNTTFDGANAAATFDAVIDGLVAQSNNQLVTFLQSEADGIPNFQINTPDVSGNLLSIPNAQALIDREISAVNRTLQGNARRAVDNALRGTFGGFRGF